MKDILIDNKIFRFFKEHKSLSIADKTFIKFDKYETNAIGGIGLFRCVYDFVDRILILFYIITIFTKEKSHSLLFLSITTNPHDMFCRTNEICILKINILFFINIELAIWDNREHYKILSNGVKYIMSEPYKSKVWIG